MRRLLCFLTVLALANAPIAKADVHLGLGTIDKIEGKATSAATLSWESDETHPWEVMGGFIYHRESLHIHTPRVWFASVSKRFTHKGWFLQGGITATSSDTEVLSRHWQFQTGAGYRYKRVTVSIRHLSNADTGGRNRGENLLLFQYKL